jgi:hypothetical protein
VCHLKKYLFKRQLPLFFLVIFFLIKANPYYYVCQYFPSIQSINSEKAISFNPRRDHHNFLVRVQKSIVEEDAGTSIPAIKFSGLLLSLFKFGSLLTLAGLYIYPPFVKIKQSRQLCLAHCVLRL